MVTGEICLADEFILETHGLTKEFAGFFAVRDVDLRVRRGSIHALIGPNGAGKTTCFNLLTKFLRPSAGQILYKGQDITAMEPADVARLGLVRSFQISAVFPHLTALENVRVALQRQHGHSFDFWRSKSVLDRFNARAHELLDDVGLSEFAATPAVEMPYGRKRALEIATTLALDPEMMLLDEPMAGMGHEDIAKIAALIKRISAKYTILMVEHNLSVVANLSDIITVLTRGHVLAEGNYADLTNDERVKEDYLGAGHASYGNGPCHSDKAGSNIRRRRAGACGSESRGMVRRVPHPSRDRFQCERRRGRHLARPQRCGQADDAEIGDGDYRQAHRLDPVQRPGYRPDVLRQDSTHGRRLLPRRARDFRQPRRPGKPAVAADRAQRRTVAGSDLRSVSQSQGTAQQPGHQIVRRRAADAGDRKNPAYRRAVPDAGRADRRACSRHHSAG